MEVPKRKPKGPLPPSPDTNLMLLVNDSRLEDTSEASENHRSSQLRGSKLSPGATTSGSLQEQQLKRENTQLRKDLASLQKEIDAVHDALEDTHDELQTKVEELVVIRQDYTALQKQSQSAQNELRTSRAQIVTLQHNLDVAQTQTREKKDGPSSPPSTDDARAQWELAKSKMIDKHQKEMDDLAAMHGREIDRLNSQHSNDLEQIKSLGEKQSQALDSEKAELQYKYADALEEARQLEAELSSVRMKANIGNQQAASNFSEAPSIGSAMQIDSSVDSAKLIEEVQASHAAEVEELRRLRDFFQSNSERLSKEIKILKSKNRDLEESVGTKDRELEDQLSHIYAMEEQIEEYRTQNSVPGGWD